MRGGAAQVGVCAPHRALHNSSVLGRATCLTTAEVTRASSGRGAAKLKSSSDRDIARSIGARDVLRPRAPGEWTRKPKAWLSNVDIDSVLHQYARVVPDFVFLGTWSSDFSEYARGLTKQCVYMCTPSPLAQAVRKRKLAAAVVNLDKHTDSGSHWVAFAFDCRGGEPRVSYYDSTGRPPPRAWMTGSAWALVAAAVPRRARRRLLANARYNCTRHQRGNTECGVFSIMMVDALIHGVLFEAHCAAPTRDADAFRRRGSFFDLS